MSGSRLCRVLPTGVALAPGNTPSCELPTFTLPEIVRISLRKDRHADNLSSLLMPRWVQPSHMRLRWGIVWLPAGFDFGQR